MKKIFLLTFLIVTTFCFAANAQTQIKKEYYPSGKLKSETPYVPGGIITGVVKMYYESGVLQAELMNENGVLNGISKVYYETGELNIEMNFVEGKKHGATRIQYKSGKLKSIKTYEHDKLVYNKDYEDYEEKVEKVEKVTCNEFPEWQKLMDKGEYEKAYNLAIEYAKFTNHSKAATAFQNSHYNGTLCWSFYRVEPVYKMGNLKLASEIIQNEWNGGYRLASEPELYYKFVKYVTEFGEKEFAANNIESAYSAIKWAVTASKVKLDFFEGKDVINDTAAEAYHLAELYGDILNKHGEQPIALQYYKLFKKSHYSATIAAKIAAIEALKKTKNDEYNLLVKLYDPNKIISVGILGEPNISFIKDIYTSFIIKDEEDKNKKSIGFKSEEITLAFNNDATELYVYIPLQNVQTRVKNKWHFKKISAIYMVWDMISKQKTLEIKIDDKNIDNSKKKEEITNAFIKNKNIIVPEDKNPNRNLLNKNTYTNFGKDVNDHYYFYAYDRKYIYTYINNGTEHQVLYLVELINENRDNYAFTNDASGKYFAYANKIINDKKTEYISFYMYNLNESDKLYTLTNPSLYQPANAKGYTTIAEINQNKKDRETTHQANLIKYKPKIDSLKLELTNVSAAYTAEINREKSAIASGKYAEILKSREWTYREGDEKTYMITTLNFDISTRCKVFTKFYFEHPYGQINKPKLVFLNYSFDQSNKYFGLYPDIDISEEYKSLKFSEDNNNYGESYNKLIWNGIDFMKQKKVTLFMEGNEVKLVATTENGGSFTFYGKDNDLIVLKERYDSIKRKIAIYEY